MHDAAAADGATHQARKQIARAAPAPVTGRLAGIAAGRKRALPSLYPLPQALIDDPQTGHVLDNPSGLRIEPGHPSSGFRVT